MAPEQAKGEVIDERADLFAIASVMLYCLIGRSFFRGDGIRETLKNIIAKPLAHVNDLLPPDRCFPELNDFLQKSMHKNKAKRYQTAQEMLDAVEKLPFGKEDYKIPLQVTDSKTQTEPSALHADAGQLRGENAPEQAEQSVAPIRLRILNLVWVALVSMSLVFMVVTWFFWNADADIKGNTAEKDDMPLSSAVPKPPKIQPEEVLKVGQAAMANQQYQAAFESFQALNEQGDMSRPVLTGLALSAFNLKRLRCRGPCF